MLASRSAPVASAMGARPRSLGRPPIHCFLTPSPFPNFVVRFWSSFFTWICLGSTSALAHHGQEFFLLYDARSPAPGNGSLQSVFSFTDEGNADEWMLSPSLNVGVLPRTAFQLRADFVDRETGDWSYRSVEPGLQFDLTPPRLKWPVRVAVAVSWQFSEDDGAGDSLHAADLSGDGLSGSTASTASQSHNHSSHSHPAATTLANSVSGFNSSTPVHDHSSHDHSNPSPPSTGSGGPDALTPEELAAMEAANAAGAPAAAAPPPNPAPATSPAPAAPRKKSSAQKARSASGAPRKKGSETGHNHAHATSGHDHASHAHPENSIHNHSGSFLTTRLILEADLTPETLLVGNFIQVLPEGGSSAFGYAIGLRHRLRPGVSIGLEALGDFNVHGHQEVLGSVFWEPVHDVMLKLGAGTGLSSVSPDATVKAGILWRF